MHNPMYSVGQWGADPYKNSIALALRRQLQGIFAEYGVDIVLQGHDHTVSRTYPIDGEGKPQKETYETENNISYLTDPDGVIYVTNGTTGGQTRSPYGAIDNSLYQYALKSNASSWAEFAFDGNEVTVSVKYGSGSTYRTWGIKKSA